MNFKSLRVNTAFQCNTRFSFASYALSEIQKFRKYRTSPNHMTVGKLMSRNTTSGLDYGSLVDCLFESFYRKFIEISYFSDHHQRCYSERQNMIYDKTFTATVGKLRLASRMRLHCNFVWLF